jgi:hypothetical protein
MQALDLEKMAMQSIGTHLDFSTEMRDLEKSMQASFDKKVSDIEQEISSMR